MPKNTALWNFHPGEILREEFLTPMKISSYALARAIHVPPPRVYDITLERRGISADTAVRFARYFGNSVEFWMNLQSSYELRLAQNKLRREVEKIIPRKQTRVA